MNGRGHCMDNVFIARPSRSLKYGVAYLQDLADGFVARTPIYGWMTLYNTDGPHSSLGYWPPAPETNVPSDWPSGSAQFRRDPN